MKILKALEITNYDMLAAESSLNMSLLGLEKYSEVIYNILNQKNVDLSDITILLIAKYLINKQEYKKYYSEFISDNEFDDDTIKYLNTLSYYFKHRGKKLKTFQKY